MNNSNKIPYLSFSRNSTKGKKSILFTFILCIFGIVFLSCVKMADKKGVLDFFGCFPNVSYKKIGSWTHSDLTIPTISPIETHDNSLNENKEYNNGVLCSVMLLPIAPYLASDFMEIAVHILEFATLVLVFGYFYMEHITTAMKDGYTDIGIKIVESISDNSEPIVNAALKSLDKFAIAADTHKRVMDSFEHNIPHTVSEKPTENHRIEEIINHTEESVSKLVDDGDIKNAEKVWIRAIKQYPIIELLDKLFSFYGQYDKEISPEHSVRTILSFESLSGFSSDPRFYRILANSYMKMRDKDGCFDDAKNGATKAAIKSIELETNNSRWRSLLGFVNYWFGDIQQAILHAKEALQIEERNEHYKNKEEHEIFIINYKNNLAYYYALARENKEIAYKFAKSVMEFYESSKEDRKKAMSYDGMGYVILRFAATNKEIEESLEFFDKAARLLPKEKIILDHIQEAYTKLKEYY